MTATMKIVLWVGIIVALAAFLVFGGDKVMYFKHIIAPAYFASSAGDNSLLAENTALRAELEKLLYIKDAVTHFKPEFLGAAVYSQYPFSSKNEIAVGVGSANGVRIGMPVIAGDILFGVIRNIYPNYSVAVTVFDNSFEKGLGEFHKFLVVGVGLVKFKLGVILRVFMRHSLVAENPSDFENFFEASH